LHAGISVAGLTIAITGVSVSVATRISVAIASIAVSIAGRARGTRLAVYLHRVGPTPAQVQNDRDDYDDSLSSHAPRYRA
jgi:hypothetical protein